MYMYGGPFETCMVEHVTMVEQLACVGTSEKEEGCLVRVSWAVHYAKYVQLYISAQKGYQYELCRTTYANVTQKLVVMYMYGDLSNMYNILYLYGSVTRF